MLTEQVSAIVVFNSLHFSMKTKSPLFYILFFVGGLAVVALILGFGFWRGISAPLLEDGETEYVYVRPSDTPDSVLQQLKGLTGGYVVTYWKIFNSVRPYEVRTGRFAVEPGQSFLTIYRNLLRGIQTPVRLTIPSVRTLDRLAGVLSHKLMMDSTEVAWSFADSTVAASYGYTVATLPALFIPNTYELYWDTSFDAFMQRMQKENEAFWKRDNRDELAKQIGMSREEVITLASIVDEETANNGEKPRVAGLYMNRLHQDIPLQADPTVKFAMGNASLRRILNIHLTTDNPYNTYRYKGLPPGPIRIPSVAGIDAVLHHEHHDYIYMCAKEDFSGTHNFAKSYAEHQQNARRYQRALNARGIK